MLSQLVVALAAFSTVSAQTYRRTGACPTLGCIFPPDQTEFIAGQVFDIRLEVQAPFNGTEAYNNGVVNPVFKLEIGGDGAPLQELSAFYQIPSATVEAYQFSYFEDLFARDNNTATVVNVLSQSYRHITLFNPGQYTIRLTYNNGTTTTAHWTVRDLVDAPTTKNVILFIGDGMTSSMVTAARLLGHKSINGKYQSKMFLDTATGFGLQMTHSLDSFITDSANSATALYSGKKGTVNALNAYTDSTGKPTGNPKFETVFEMFKRITGGAVGIVSTAYLADATPAAVVAHTSQRSQYDLIIDQFLDGVTGYPWTQGVQPDVIFGGGGSDFLPKASNKNVSKIAKFIAKGYEFVTDNTTLHAIGNDKRALGLFSTSTMPTWLDRNVYTKNLKTFGQYNGTLGVMDSPGLLEMTIKAIDILVARSNNAGTGFMLMSEAASIDKAMHIADYERALGEVLELDQTVAATVQHLKDIGIYDNTLVIVTADHGHGFDVFGGADTAYLKNAPTDGAKRDAVGTYQNSGLSAYQVAPGQLATNQSVITGPQGPGFPVNWAPRYTAAFGVASVVDHYENFGVGNTSRLMSKLAPNSTTMYVANPTDSHGVGGFYIQGNLPISNDQGVHSLTDVPVYAWGAGHESFRGVMNSPDIMFKIAEALNLGRNYNATIPMPVIVPIPAV